MTHRLLTGEAWTILEMDVRGILTEHGVPGEFWLVHDLMVAFRIALEGADLIRIESVQEHFKLSPITPPGDTKDPPDSIPWSPIPSKRPGKRPS